LAREQKNIRLWNFKANRTIVNTRVAGDGLMSVLRNYIRTWRESIPVTILFGLVGTSLLRKIFDYDVWFHMVVGREVLRQMRIPDVEFYILTRLGEPGEFHEWGFGVLYYLINQYSGYVGMAVANAAFGCGILLFLYLASRCGAESEWWKSLPIIALVLWVIDLRLNFRPETLLYLLLAVEIYLLENYLQHRKISWLIPLPFLSWLLSLGHPSALVLIGVFGIYALQAVFTTAVNKSRLVAEMTGVTLAMAGGAMLNPYGLHQLLLPFYFQNDELINSLTENLPVLQTEYALHFIVSAVIGLLALVFGPRRRLVDGVLVFAFAMLTFRYARNIALLGIVLFVPVNNAFEVWLEKLSGIFSRKFIILCSVVPGIAGIALAGASPLWGTGIYESNTPYNSSAMIRKYMQSGNILNFIHLGNFLAWDLDRPVFVDGRNYGSNRAVQLHHAIFRADPGWQDIINGYDIQAILTPATLDFSGKIIPLVATLAYDPDWILVGREKAGLLFFRNPVQPGIRTLAKNVIWHQAIEELNATMTIYPDSKETYRSLATAYGELGDVAKQQFFSSKFSTLPD
jgi:hypothetical protein